MKSGVVIKAFPYASDGINIDHLAEGRELEFPDTTFDGLEAAGYIKAGKKPSQKTPQVDDVLNARLIEAIDKRLTAASDQDLKDIIARSGTPYSGNLVHARLVYAAKEQMIREAEGAPPVMSINPNAGVTEQPLSAPGAPIPPAATAAIEAMSGATDANAGENKATNQFGDPLPNRQTADKGEGKADDVDLEKMTKAELEKLAGDRGVDIADAKTKADIIEAINAGKPA